MRTRITETVTETVTDERKRDAENQALYTMRALLKRPNNFCKRSTNLRDTSTIWLILIVVSIQPASSLESDCREVSRDTSEQSTPDVCTVRLDLNASEVHMVRSLADRYGDRPMRCRVGMYTLFCNTITIGL